MDIDIDIRKLTEYPAKDSKGSNRLKLEDIVSVWDAESLQQYRLQRPARYERLSEVIDNMGKLSATAQALPQIITTTSRVCATDNILYLLAQGAKALGILKVGRKKLFYRVSRSTTSSHGIWNARTDHR